MQIFTKQEQQIKILNFCLFTGLFNRQCQSHLMKSDQEIKSYYNQKQEEQIIIFIMFGKKFSVALDASWAEISKKYFSGFPTILAFQYDQQNLNFNISVKETINLLGISHCKHVFQVESKTSNTPTYAWIIGFSEDSSTIEAKEYQILKLEKKNLIQISTQPRIDLTQKNLSFTIRNDLVSEYNLDISVYLENSEIFQNSFLFAYKDNDDITKTTQIVGKLDALALNSNIGFSHKKALIQKPSKGFDPIWYIFFNESYEAVLSVIKKLSQTVGNILVYHPTTQMNFKASSSKLTEIKKGITASTGQSVYGGWEDRRSKYGDPDLIILELRNLSQSIKSFKYLYTNQWNLLDDFNFLQGYDSNSPSSSPYSIIVQADSSEDIDILDNRILIDRTLQLGGSSKSFFRPKGKNYKSYLLYQNPDLLKIAMKQDPIAPNFSFGNVTTRILLNGSTKYDQDSIKGLLRANRLKGQISADYQLIVTLNSNDDATLFFQAIVKDTKFDPVFMKEDVEQEKQETDTNQSSSEKGNKKLRPRRGNKAQKITIKAFSTEMALKMLKLLINEDLANELNIQILK